MTESEIIALAKKCGALPAGPIIDSWSYLVTPDQLQAFAAALTAPDKYCVACRKTMGADPAQPAAQEQIRYMNLVMDLRRVLGWEKPLNNFPEIAELEALLATHSNNPSATITQPAALPVSHDDIETAAKAIYESWQDQKGYVPWQDGGNSNMQDKARDLARKARKAAAQEPAANMYPSDLERFKSSECYATAYSVEVVNKYEESVPLYTHPQESGVGCYFETASTHITPDPAALPVQPATQDDFDLRGLLASKLSCWHRLTELEAENLLDFVRAAQEQPAQPAAQEP
jgi:hypothetical protein